MTRIERFAMWLEKRVNVAGQDLDLEKILALAHVEVGMRPSTTIAVLRELALLGRVRLDEGRGKVGPGGKA